MHKSNKKSEKKIDAPVCVTLRVVCMDVGTLYYEQNISNKHTQKPLNEFQ